MFHLEIKNLKKTYSGIEILHNISFAVKAGEFISLLGPSGCGKSTTLRCIAGLEIPDQCEDSAILLDGQKLSSYNSFVVPEKRRFGMVFQSYAVWPHMNVFENTAFPLRQKKGKSKLSDSEINKRVLAVLDLVQLHGLEKRYGFELSGGQQQRVALARAIAMEPEVLLLDEPLSNLDVILREEMRVEIARIQKTLKMTTILVTHDQREALSLSDRIIVMNKGNIEAVGSPQELYGSSPTPFVAEFLSGAQLLEAHDGSTITLFPRKWDIYSLNEASLLSGPAEKIKARVISGLFLGYEYEYLVQSEIYQKPLRLFSARQFADGSEVILTPIE